jgi:hypothetical protein
MGVGFLTVFLLTSLSCLFLLGVILYLILTPETLELREKGLPSPPRTGESISGKHLPKVKNA